MAPLFCVVHPFNFSNIKSTILVLILTHFCFFGPSSRSFGPRICIFFVLFCLFNWRSFIARKTKRMKIYKYDYQKGEFYSRGTKKTKKHKVKGLFWYFHLKFLIVACLIFLVVNVIILAEAILLLVENVVLWRFVRNINDKSIIDFDSSR